MARPLRIIYEGAFYHVTARGNERKRIFLSRTDKEKFLSYLQDGIRKYGVVLHAYVLMENHYHLLVETPKANLPSFMHTLNSAYTTYFNIKRKRSGHLFQGRYKAFLVSADSYLLELSRYIHLNPVRSGIVKKPEEYPYSSYRLYILPNQASIVSRDLIWDAISKNQNKAPQFYRVFVESALDKEIRNPFEEVYGGILLGSKAFIKDVLTRAKDEILQKKDISHQNSLTGKTSDLQEIIHRLSVHFKVSEEKIIAASPYKAYAVYLAKRHTPLSNAEIGEYFGGISFSAVTKIGTRLKDRMIKDRRIKSELATVEESLSRVKA
jgi:REP element-mobilizing transposase RayT